jgi:tRNA A-37 threonylcarbamoyl transferase component Bud32
MAARIVQTFQGFSGSKVYLMHKHGSLFVRKVGNNQRNLERLQHLSGRVPVPAVYGQHGENLDIEYVHGVDMRSWLISNPAKPLLDFLIEVTDTLGADPVQMDRTQQYQEFLQTVNPWPFQFTQEELACRMPADIPSTDYIGDLTLENIIATDHGFVMIDCQTTIWDSVIYDIAKLRQDLECHWFLRAKPAMLENKLAYIQRGLLERWPQASDNTLLLLMLLRVFRYCQPHSAEHDFLIKEINRLCK